MFDLKFFENIFIIVYFSGVIFLTISTMISLLLELFISNNSLSLRNILLLIFTIFSWPVNVLLGYIGLINKLLKEEEKVGD